MTPPSTSTTPAPESGAAPDDAASVVVPSPRTEITEHARIPAQVIRRPADAPRPVPSPRSPQPEAAGTATPSTGYPAPAGLPSADVPGLYAPEPTGETEPLAGWALLLGILVPPLGVGVGLVALARIRRYASNGRGLAVSGVVVGALISAVMVLTLVLSALVGVGAAGSSDPSAPGGSSAGAVSQTCSGTICTVTAQGAPVTINGIGAGGADGVSVLAVGEGSAVIASPQGPLEVPTGTALELGRGTQVVLTQASADTVVLVYGR